MPQWLIILKPARPGMADHPTELEQTIVAAHYAYLRQALTDRRLILAGRTTDKNAMGLVIFDAPDESAARAFMEFDPAVRQGVMTGEVRPYRVALSREEP